VTRRTRLSRSGSHVQSSAAPERLRPKVCKSSNLFLKRHGDANESQPILSGTKAPFRVIGHRRGGGRTRKRPAYSYERRARRARSSSSFATSIHELRRSLNIARSALFKVFVQIQRKGSLGPGSGSGRDPDGPGHLACNAFSRTSMISSVVSGVRLSTYPDTSIAGAAL
jgi:hypothetical protein